VARTKRPSRAVVAGGTAGTAAGTLIELGAAAAGIPLPPGTGALITGVLTAFISWKSRGGRKGESD
jgi:hypothetical protein